MESIHIARATWKSGSGEWPALCIPIGWLASDAYSFFSLVAIESQIGRQDMSILRRISLQGCDWL